MFTSGMGSIYIATIRVIWEKNKNDIMIIHF